MSPAQRIEREIIIRGRTAAAARQADCCKYCFEPFSVSPATAEHRVPRSKGGSNLEHNIEAACGRCNKLKASMTAGQFLKLIKQPPASCTLELLLANSRRKIWLKTHRSCKNIARSVGMKFQGPVGQQVREAA